MESCLSFHFFAPLLEVRFEPSRFRALRLHSDFEEIFRRVRQHEADRLLALIAGRELAVAAMHFYQLGTSWQSISGGLDIPTALVFLERGGVDLELLQVIFENRMARVHVGRSEAVARAWLARQP